MTLDVTTLLVCGALTVLAGMTLAAVTRDPRSPLRLLAGCLFLSAAAIFFTAFVILVTGGTA